MRDKNMSSNTHLSLSGAFEYISAAALLFLAAAMFSAPAWSAQDNNECSRETPMPNDIKVTPPASSVPEKYVRFSSAWIGS